MYSPCSHAAPAATEPFDGAEQADASGHDSATARWRWAASPLCLLGALVLLSALVAVALRTSPLPAPARLTPQAILQRAHPELLYDARRPPLDANGQVAIAMCTINLWQAMGRVGQAGLAIDALTRNCNSPLDDRASRSKCSATITALIAQISLLAALLSSAASDCALTTNVHGRCAADVGGLVGNLAVVATTGASVYQTCNRDHRPKTPMIDCVLPKIDAMKDFDSPDFNNTDLLYRIVCRKGKKIAALGRRLAPAGPSWPNSTSLLGRARSREQAARARSREQAGCFFNVVQATGFLARFGVGIQKSVTLCDEDALDGHEGKRKCVANVLGILGAFELAAQFVAGAVNNCPLEDRVDAQCARDITGMIGALTASAAFATDIGAACGGQFTPGEVLPAEDERRLAATTA